MKDQNQLTDDIFRQGFSRHEAAFDPAAWEHMQTLLDKDSDLKPVLFIHDNTNKKRNKLFTLIITIMSLLTLLTLASTLLVNHNSAAATDKTASGSALSRKSANTAKQTENAVLTPGKNSMKVVPKKSNKAASAKKKSATAANSGQTTVVSSTTTATDITTLADNDPIKPVKPVSDTFITAIKNGKMYKVLTRTTWIPETYEWVESSKSKTITDGFFGMHFTSERPRNTNNSSAGFNIQFMSGNNIFSEHWGLYGGLDWGMQFYQKGNKSNVALNNTRGDSGFTRLRSHSMDFLGRGHFEYAKYALVPYVNIMTGPRIYATNQQVASYVPLKETESSTSNNVHTSASMMYGFGAGLRLKISPFISLDARYEWLDGTNVKQVDLTNSTFNGLSYDLKYTTVKPRQEQFKFGIIIDLSEKDYEKKIIKEGYYKITTIDSLQIDAKDSNKIYLPCNCDPCPKNSNTSNDAIVYPREREYRQDDQPTERNRSNTNSNSGSNGSGSKGDFPGIRPPAPKPVNPK